MDPILKAWPPDGTRFRARWVFPVDGEPIENGVVEIDGIRIAAIHDRPDPKAEPLGDVAIVPSLVNAHTHLEFSDLDEPLGPSEPFTGWIRRLVGHRLGRGESTESVVRRGLSESAASGVGVVGEIATEGWSDAAFGANAPKTVVFRELIGLSDERAEEQLEVARAHLAATDVVPSGGKALDRGLSPHAPYSVRFDLYESLVSLAGSRGAPVAVHLAETLSELELLEQGTGEFAEMLTDFGVWNAAAFARPRRPLDYLEPLADLEHALVVHGNHLADDEIRFLVRHPQVALVYCPRTHEYFGHPARRTHPWLALLEAGGSVCLGTDGRGSNPDLSVLGEMQFLRTRFPAVPPRLLLELGTWAGARALGVADEFGVLGTGRPAHLAVVALPAGSEGDPYAALLHPASNVAAAMRRGHWVR